jgi:hypothetical protein
MSAKNISHGNQSNSRTYFYNSKKKQSRKKKTFQFPINKTYTEENDHSPTKENQPEEFNLNTTKNNYDKEMLYEDEYQGLIYRQIYPDINANTIYYYLERDRRDEYNNFKTKWKTEICRYWEMYGECKYGDNCAFAHGDSELKQRKMTFNYKTKPCKQFFEIGYCSYGTRCQFSHKKEDLKDQKKETQDKNNNISYLKIIEELLSEDNNISHELIKRPRLMTFENITHCTLEESENSKLQLYKDIINLKNSKSKNDFNNSFKLLEDTDSKSNASSDNANDKEDY